MAFLFRRQQPPPPPPPGPCLPLDRLIQPALAAYIAGNSTSDNAASQSGQVVQKGTLAAVANSIRRCVSGMSPWDISDLTLGLYKIATRHALEGTSDTIDGSVVSDKQELEEMLHWLDWAWASYLADEKSIIEFLKIKEQQLKKHVNTSAILKPAYCIAIDDAKNCVVMSIRGTYAATDVLTDLQPHSEEFEGGFAHSGILSAARWILDNETENLQILLSENLGYKLVVTGHSLGAGAASLLSFLLRESAGSRNQSVSLRLGIPTSMIECWGFGCPPCVDRHLCEHAAFIKNVVLQDDIVARASIAALEDLRSEILQTDWAHVLEDGGIAKKMLGLVKSTNSALGNVEQALGYERGTFYQQAKSLSYAAMVESFRASMGSQHGSYGPSGYYGMHGPSGYYGMHGPAGHYDMHGPAGYHGPPVQYCMNGPPPPHGMQGPRPQSLMGWLSLVGTSAISSYLNTPENANQTQGKDAITSKEFIEGGRLFAPGVLYHIKRSPLEANSTSTSIMRDHLSNLVTEIDRLSLAENADTEFARRGITEQDSRTNAEAGVDPVVPMRHSIVQGSDRKSRFMTIIDRLRLAENADTEVARRRITEKDSRTNVEAADVSPVPMRHSIVKGSDPKSRFMKIILSKSLLSDHSLVAYKDGIKDAIHWNTEV